MLTPNPQLVLGGFPLVWLTDLDTPDPRGLGLTSDYLMCDRTAMCATVAGCAEIEPWGAWAHRYRVTRELRDALEDGALPGHWYVAEAPLIVRSLAAVTPAHNPTLEGHN